MIKKTLLIIVISLISTNLWLIADPPQLEMILPVDTIVHTIPPIILESNYYTDVPTIKDMCPYQMFDNDTEETMDIFLLETSIMDEFTSDWYPIKALHCYVEIESDTRLRLKPTQTLKPNTEYTLHVAYNAFKVLVPDGLGGMTSTPIGSLEKSFKTHKELYYVTGNNFREIENPDGTINCCQNFTLTLNQALDPADYGLQAGDIFKLYRELFVHPDSTGPREYRTEVPCTVTMSEGNTAVAINPNEDMHGKTYYTLICDLDTINGYYDGNLSEQFLVKGTSVIKITPISEDGSELTDHINVKPGIYEYVVRPGEELTFDIPFETENYYLEEVRNPMSVNGIQHPVDGFFSIDIDCCNLEDVEIFPVYKPIPIDCITIGAAIVIGYPATPEVAVDGSGYISRNGNTFCAKRYSTTPLTISVTDTSEEYEFVGWQSSDGKDYGTEPRLVLSEDRAKEMSEFMTNSGDITLQPIFEPIIKTDCQALNFEINIEYEKDPFLDDSYQNVADFIEYVKMGLHGAPLTPMSLASTMPRTASANLTVMGPWDPPEIIKVDAEIKVKDNYPFEISSIHLGGNNFIGEKVHNFDDERIFSERLGKQYSLTMTKSSLSNNCTKTVTVYVRRNVKKYEMRLREKDYKYLSSVNGLDIICKPAPPAHINFPYSKAEDNENKADIGGIPIFYYYDYNKIPAENNSQITEIFADFYFYEGSEVTLTPFVRYGSGWSFYKWNDEPAFDVGVLNPDNGFTITMDNDKNSELLINEEFKLEYVSEMTPTEYMLDSTGKSVRRELIGDLFIEYKIDDYDAYNKLGPYVDASLFNKGMGLLISNKWPENDEVLRKYHINTCPMFFVFNDAIDEQSLIGNFYLKDKGIPSDGLAWTDGTNHKEDHPGLRPDGYMPQVYRPRPEPYYPEQQNDSNYWNPNTRTINGVLDDSTRVNNTIKFYPTSWNHSDGEGYWIPAMNKFDVVIKNDLDAPASSRIRSASGQPLMNVIPATNRKEKIYERVTAPPGINMKIHGFELSESKYDGADLFIHEMISVLNHSGELIIAENDSLWKHDENGRIAFKNETVYYPSKIGVDYWDNGDHFQNIFKWTDEKEKILEHQYISAFEVFNISYFMFKKANGPLSFISKAIIEPLEQAFFPYLDSLARATVNDQIGLDIKFNFTEAYDDLGLFDSFKLDKHLGEIKYVLSQWHNTEVQTVHNHPRRYNEFRKYMDIYETEDIMDNGEAVTRGDISNWGVGKYGLYQAWSLNNGKWGKYYDQDGKPFHPGWSTQAIIYIIVGDTRLRTR